MHPDQGDVGRDGSSPIAVTMSGMPEVWQGLLDAHVQDEHGRCAACRNAGTAGVRWPCTLRVIAENARSIYYGPAELSDTAACDLAG
jgi:hypothetical protein